MHKKKPSQVLKKLIKIIILMRKPIVRRLIRLKNSRKMKRKFKLLSHYNYRYIHEYQFSPSNTPPFQYYRKPMKQRSFKLYSVFPIPKCLDVLRDEEEITGLESLPCIKFDDRLSNREVAEMWDSCSEDESVDEKAERFIKKFYEEMRIQRQESILKLNSMLEV